MQIEVLDPGAVICGKTNIPLYINPPKPFVIWPEKMQWELGHAFDAIVVKEMMARVHIQAMGTAMDMVTLGDLDFLLTLHPVEKLFAPWISKWVAKVVQEVKPENYYRKWCQLAAFDVNVNQQEIEFAGWLPEGKALQAVLN